jgi:hypothetical protein
LLAGTALGQPVVCRFIDVGCGATFGARALLRKKRPGQSDDRRRSAAFLARFPWSDRRAAMADVERAKNGAEHLAIRAAVRALDEVSKEFARRRMNDALEHNVRGQTVGDVEKKVTGK